MSETKHSPEPWRDERPDEHYGWVKDAGGRVLLGEGNYLCPDDRRRLIAAMNSVAGIPTEALESGALAKALRLALEPLKLALGHVECDVEIDRPCNCGAVEWNAQAQAAVDAICALIAETQER